MVGKCLHELAQDFRCVPIFGHAGPLERLSEFLFDTYTKPNVFARHAEIVSWIHVCVSKKCVMGRAPGSSAAQQVMNGGKRAKPCPLTHASYSQTGRGGVFALRTHPLRYQGESWAGRRPEGGRDFALRQYELKPGDTGWSGEGFGVSEGVTARKRHYVQRTVRRRIVQNAISYRIMYCISYRIIVLYIHTK